jgi:hypothetical protein
LAEMARLRHLGQVIVLSIIVLSLPSTLDCKLGDAPPLSRQAARARHARSGRARPRAGLTAPNPDPNGLGDDTKGALAPQTPSPAGRPPPRSLPICGRRALGPGCPRADHDHHPLSPRCKPRHHLAARCCAAAAVVHPPLTRRPRPPAPHWVLARDARAREHAPADYLPHEHPAQRLPRDRRPRAPRVTAAERTAAASTPRNGCREDGGREHPFAHSTNLLGPCPQPTCSDSAHAPHRPVPTHPARTLPTYPTAQNHIPPLLGSCPPKNTIPPSTPPTPARILSTYTTAKNPTPARILSTYPTAKNHIPLPRSRGLSSVSHCQETRPFHC